MWNLQRKKSEYRVVKSSRVFYLAPGITAALFMSCVLNFIPQTQVIQALSLTSGNGVVISSGQKQLHIIPVLSDYVVRPVLSDCMQTFNKMEN